MRIFPRVSVMLAVSALAIFGLVVPASSAPSPRPAAVKACVPGPWAQCQGATLTGSLKGADLYKINLTNATLNRVDFTNAILTKAKMAGTMDNGSTWAGAGLQEAQISRMRFSASPDAPSSFARVKFTGATFLDVQFSGVDLTKATFDEALLNNSGFADLTLSPAVLKGARFTGVASFSRVTMKEITLAGAGKVAFVFDSSNLSRANLAGLTIVNTHRSSLGEANLTAADMSKGDHERAKFDGAAMARVDMSHSKSQGASFQQANLAKADLRGTDLRGADFRGADMTGADLRGANLEGALFSYATLTGVKWTDSDPDTETICPNGELGPYPCWIEMPDSNPA
ncbi:MAG TPA: hypothetical protein DDY88_02485 [Actinobacteria bacterium]|nr:hypothetical protein [Actinomycetota bacterium]